jgi:hypothetical protein
MSGSSSTTSPTPADPDRRHRRLAVIVLGLTAAIAVMVLAFAAPALNAGAEDLPLAVSGPGPATEQFTATLEAQNPGTFDVTTHDSVDQAEDAIRHQEAIGGVVLSESGMTIQTATGAGAPYASLLRGIGSQLAASDQDVTYSELAPTTEDDPTGLGISALGLPLIFGGMATAAALLLGYRGSVMSRLVAASTLAVLAGLVGAAILQFGFGAFDGSYWFTAAALAAGITAISFTVLGLGLLVGYPGLAAGAVLTLFVSNPLSGLASGPAWLPPPWGEIGQYLPVGAAGSAIRSAVYFDGHGSAGTWLVLAAWAFAGLALAGFGRARATTNGK